MKKKKVMILVNHDLVIYNFRKELVKRLLDDDFEVIVVSPYGDRIELLLELGIKFFEIDIERHGMNPINEVRLIYVYRSIIKKINPDIILTYTIKPNIYGSLAARNLKIPLIANITGLGNAVNSDSVLSRLISLLYKFSFETVRTIFFQNESDLYKLNSIIMSEHKSILLPGSGVNLDEFKFENLALNKDIEFLYFGRVMQSKGIYELLEAFEKLSKIKDNISLKIVGFYDDKKIEDQINNSVNRTNIKYLPHVTDVKDLIKKSDAVILPSYHEGMSNALLEGAAMGRPLLASNIPGCKEIIDDGVNGFLFEPRSSDAIVEAVEKFMALSFEERQEMGRKSREKVEREFDRQIVVDAYMEEIERILGDS